MNSLYNYCSNTIDGHIHLFDCNGPLSWTKDKKYTILIGFMDVDWHNVDLYTKKNVLEYYDNYINNVQKKTNTILLATGTTAEQAISVYNKYPDVIKGFGEFKCYDEALGETVEYGDLEWIRPVLLFNLDKNLPVYIHFDLDTKTHINQLKSLLTQFNTMPIVLCHCGMPVDATPEKLDKIFATVLGLLNDFNNLYIDISYTATNYFLTNSNKLCMLQGRAFFGSDINPILRRNHGTSAVAIEYNKLNKLNNIMNGDIVLRKLFNI